MLLDAWAPWAHDQLALPMPEQSWRCREPDLAGMCFAIKRHSGRGLQVGNDPVCACSLDSTIRIRYRSSICTRLHRVDHPSLLSSSPCLLPLIASRMPLAHSFTSS